MYKMIVFVPESHLEQVKDALFNAGAGEIGAYSHCCWQVLGMGQFKPGSGSQPAIGEQGLISRVEEYRLEVVCENTRVRAALQAMIAAHPYETPAYEAFEIKTLEDF